MRDRLIALLMVFLALAGCVVYPRPVEHYDSECKIRYKQLVLEPGGLNGIRFSCTNEACIAALLLIPIGALVAGSIVIVGNTVYWLEKEGRCLLKDD